MSIFHKNIKIAFLKLYFKTKFHYFQDLKKAISISVLDLLIIQEQIAFCTHFFFIKF